MQVGLINNFDNRTAPEVIWQIDQFKAGHLAELWLVTPHEDAIDIANHLDLPLDKIFDLSSQTYLSEQADSDGLWFYDLPVPNQAQLVVNPDWTKAIVSSGRVLADVRWFANSNRLVQAVSWKNILGEIDRKEIYQRNGRLFARQYFDGGQLLQSDFYIGQDQVVMQDFYFQGNRNYVLDQELNHFPNAEEHIKAVMRQRPDCEIQLCSLGWDLNLALPGTKLALPAGILTANQEVDPQLKDILQNSNHAVTTVALNRAAEPAIREAKLPTTKITWLD
ncbi:hypothetical protein [Fructobacillus ficulneus]|uniref:Glycosyltransferase n=1 Tax=Fructobacillus ficulneus TaxID=157463 RepID=A0A0K8MHS5_9LACO|nr:hypothetical protein [Fructobacillus ficulneus]GAP00111.1 glycosyltransferase [Fructobacillus ficulneus]